MRLLLNTWSLSLSIDPNSSEDIVDFQLQGSLNLNKDLKGHNFQLLSLVVGRRACLVMNLGLHIMNELGTYKLQQFIILYQNWLLESDIRDHSASLIY